MAERFVLDTGPLGRLVHPRASLRFLAWIDQQLASGSDIVIPEIADYELRRNLLLEGLSVSLSRLDRLVTVLSYLPLTTAVMRLAAEFWAEVRRAGRPTAHHTALDGDAILAAQASSIAGVVVTDNIGHLSRFPIEVRRWTELVQ
jgi:predicted nucleic acid-binding protein